MIFCRRLFSRLLEGVIVSSGKRLCAANYDIHFLNIVNNIIYVIVLVAVEVVGVEIGVKLSSDTSIVLVVATINCFE